MRMKKHKSFSILITEDLGPTITLFITDEIEVKSIAFFDDIQPRVKGTILDAETIVTARFYIKHCSKSNSFCLIKRFKSFREAKDWLDIMLNSCPDFVKDKLLFEDREKFGIT